MMYGRRRKLSAEEVAANAAARAQRAKLSMTCQVCGRPILANTGVIAHHGYTRPFEGFQTGSCSGARHVPFEVSRDQLGNYIEALQDHCVRLIMHRANVAAEKAPITLHYAGPYRYPRREELSCVVTRATWDAVLAEHKPKGLFRHAWDEHQKSFDKELAADIARRNNEIRMVETDIREQTKRFDGWKRTHEWDGGRETWHKLG